MKNKLLHQPQHFFHNRAGSNRKKQKHTSLKLNFQLVRLHEKEIYKFSILSMDQSIKFHKDKLSQAR